MVLAVKVLRKVSGQTHVADRSWEVGVREKGVNPVVFW